ncbi:GSCOCG00006953001-RA-CDS [Cotesia congregata]|nr:GSCOCG00006953001-RA-CDS [Cotesia congregata]
MLIKKIIEGIFIAIIPQLIGIQGTVEIIIEDAFCSSFSEEYITEPDVYVDVNNRVFVNFSIVKQFSPDAQFHFKILGASMGEYVIQTGLEIQMSLCEMKDEPVILAPVLQMFGFREDECPPSVGVYGNENIEIPMELLPDEFIPNKYLGIGELLYEEEKLVVIMLYITVH